MAQGRNAACHPASTFGSAPGIPIVRQSMRQFFPPVSAEEGHAFHLHSSLAAFSRAMRKSWE